MDWLFQGIIVNAIWIGIAFLFSLIAKLPNKKSKEKDLHLRKIYFHMFLFYLVFYTAISFSQNIFRFMWFNDYIDLIIGFIPSIFLYALVVIEYNKIFNKLNNKNLDNKQKRAKNKSK